MKKSNFWTILMVVIFAGLFIAAWNEYSDINRKLKIDMAKDVYGGEKDRSHIPNLSKFIDCSADGVAAHLKKEVGFLNFAFGYIVNALTWGHLKLPSYRKLTLFDGDALTDEASYVIMKCVDEYRTINNY